MNIPEIYLSGGFALNYNLEKEMLKRSGCKYRCFSAAFVVPGNIHYNERIAACNKASEDRHVKIMLDSGAFSLHTIQQSSAQRGRLASYKHTLDIEQMQKEMYKRYIAYVKGKLKKKQIEFFVTLDFVKDQPTIFAMQKQFAADGLTPMPVFHGDSGIEWLKKYASLGITYIGIGTIQTRVSFKKKMKYFDMVFNEGEKLGLKFHGFAATRFSYMVNFPFKSVDSSSWTKAASYGFILLPPSTRSMSMGVAHISERMHGAAGGGFASMSKSRKNEINELMGRYGFELKKMISAHTEREVWNAFVFSNLKRLCADSGVTGIIGDYPRTKWESLL